MDEQLDNDLRDRIKEVFENIDNTSADEGWLLLREKFPEGESKRRGFAWLWWGSVAAVLLLVAGLGIWINTEHIEPKKISYKAIKPLKHEKQVTSGYHKNTASKTAPVISADNLVKSSTGHQKTNAQPLKGPGKTNPTAQPALVNKLASNDIAAKNAYMARKNAENAKIKTNNVQPQQVTITANPNGITTNPNTVAVIPNAANTNANTMAVKPNNVTVNPDAVANPGTAPADKILPPQQPKAKSIEDMFAEDKNTLAIKNDKKLKNDKKVRFEIYEATYFNYAKGSNSQVNAGAGFTSNIKISNNLRLVTGVSIGQNTLSYTGGLPPTNNQSTDAVSLARPSFPYGVASPSSLATINNTAVTTTFKDYNASLVGLDIPVNLKYEFNPQQSDTYISAGLSSGTFINESYTSQYNYSSFFSPSSQETQSETTTKSFNGFYFAKTLNVAFGVGYPLGKNHLVIEPFLKYPLEGLGSQQIRFGSGGINLKFNFESLKK
jgi:hypothetical protein